MSPSAALGIALTIGAAGYLALAVYVWRHREVSGAGALLVMLLAVGTWTICYALELSSTTVQTAQVWSALKYIGIVLLPPALWSFVMQYTGRSGPLPRRVLMLLAIEPALVLGLLVFPATRDLIHTYPPVPRRVAGAPVPDTGSLFWITAVYTYVLMLGAIAVLVVRLLRVAVPYRRAAIAIVVASVLPFLGNVVYNLDTSDPPPPDPTPFLFTLTAVVLVWGFFRLRLLDVMPVARDAVVERMADGVLVLDLYGRIMDANPAGSTLLGMQRSRLVGRYLSELVPELADLVQAHRPGMTSQADSRVWLGLQPEGSRTSPVPPGPAGAAAPPGRSVDLAVSVTDVTDPAGRHTANLLVLADITERKRAERQLRELLDAQTQLSQTLQQSLRPASLPEVPGLRMTARSIPAGRGTQVSGDFYDVHPAGPRRWAFVLGDVSGKGVDAAIVTSMARYTVRTLSAQPWLPHDVLDQLNQALRVSDDAERFCTVVYGQITSSGQHPVGAGEAPYPTGLPPVSGMRHPRVPAMDRCPGRERGVQITLALGGHPPPLLRRRDGSVQPVGVPGTALGLLPEVDVHDMVIDLHPGDALLAYTDGVIEARRGTELFGDERLAEVVSAAGGELDLDEEGPIGPQLAGQLADAVADRVLSAVEGFTVDRDDVAMLVLAAS